MKNFLEKFKHENVRPALRMRRKKFNARLDLLKVVLILGAATAGGFLFMHIGYDEANTLSLYILGVMLISFITSLWVFGVLSAIAGTFLFNCIFAEPQFNFIVYDNQYTVILVLMVIASAAISIFMMRFRYHAEQESLQLERTEALLDTSQKLQATDTISDALRVTAEQVHKIFGYPVIMFELQDGERKPPFLAGEDKSCLLESHVLAEFVEENYRQKISFRYQAGDYKVLFFVLNASGKPHCVLGLLTSAQEYLSKTERSLVLALLDETALTVEKNILSDLNFKMANEAESERLRSSLLRTISHDLRTPLTGISGNASILLKNAENLSDESKHKIYENIYEDADWLINMVENLLFITRLENGNMSIHLETEFLQDVIESVFPQLDRRKKEHKLTIDIEDDMLTAQVDAPLISQVIINIVDNAVKYTPPETEIKIKAFEKDDMAVIEISDEGPGIKEKDRVFEMFFTSGKTQPDGRRGIGLGLSSCRAIVTAHGGEIYARDNVPHGAVIGFTLKREKVNV